MTPPRVNGGRSAARPATGQTQAWSRHLVLAVLCLVGLLNYVDRQIISILLQPIKETFHASDTAMGVLTGILFAGVFSVISVPLARLSDVGSRRTVLAACIAFWSILTSLGGLAMSFWQLALTRVGVAAAEGGGMPASHSIITDLYPPAERTRALSVFASSQSIGIGLGVFLGGWLSQLFDWRMSFFIVGAPGLLAAILVRLMPEPQRGLADQRPDSGLVPTFREAVRTLWSMPSLSLRPGGHRRGLLHRIRHAGLGTDVPDLASITCAPAWLDPISASPFRLRSS